MRQSRVDQVSDSESVQSVPRNRDQRAAAATTARVAVNKLIKPLADWYVWSRRLSTIRSEQLEQLRTTRSITRP
jgi:hypothetical protein